MNFDCDKQKKINILRLDRNRSLELYIHYHTMKGFDMEYKWEVGVWGGGGGGGGGGGRRESPP